MSSTLELLGEKVKGLATHLSQHVISRRLKFMPSLTSGGGGYGYSAAGELALRHSLGASGTSTGPLDLETAAGDVLHNSVVAACVNAMTQALPEAPVLLERRVAGVEFERVESHPVLDLLHNPNPYLSEAELWGVTTAFERTRGEAYWYFEYDAERTFPREIWFRAPEYVQIQSDDERFISGYQIQSESGQMVLLDERDVVHFRHQLSTVNPRAGWSPIQTGKRQIVGDNSAAAYHSAILRNAGAASLIISLKDAAAAGEVTPGQLDEYVQKFKRKVSGEGAGAILGMDLPLDVHKVGFSPDEMAIDKILNYYESRICALMGVNRRVINLGQDPTYENSRVALKDFWGRTILPMRKRHAATLSSQLLPLFGLDPAVYRLRFDFSEVEALRDDVDGLHARWRATLLAGGVDLYTFQQKIGLVPDESYRGRYIKPSEKMDAGDADEAEMKYSPNQLRDRNGRWSGGGGVLHAMDDGLTGSGAWSKPPQKATQFTTKEEATDWLQNGFGEAYNSVEEREKAAVFGYKEFTFDSINEILRTGNSDVKSITQLGAFGEIVTIPATIEQIKSDEIPAFDRAISKFPLPNDIVVERVTDAPYWQGKLEKGQEFKDPAYQSVTVLPDYSAKILKKRQMAKAYEQMQLERSGSSEVVPTVVTLEINLRKGQHALPMQPFERERATKDDYQYELLLPRNGKMIVKDVIEEAGKPKRIVLDWEQ